MKNCKFNLFISCAIIAFSGCYLNATVTPINEIVNSVTNPTAPPASPSTPQSFNSSVNKILNLTGGGYLAVGNFSAFASSRAPRIVSLNSDGTVSSAMSAITTGFDKLVQVVVAELDTSGNATGKILVGGNFTSYNGTPAYNLVRLNADGSLDTGFGTSLGTPMMDDGQVTSIIQEQNIATGLPTGKFLIGGHFNTVHGVASSSGYTRLNSDGTVDSSYTANGCDGRVVRMELERNTATGLPTGKMYLLGVFWNCDGVDVPNYFVRVNADGSHDNTFNNGGVGIGTSAYYSALSLEYDTAGLPTGNILVGQSVNTYNGVSTGSRIIVRFNSSGAYDSSFNSSGLGIDPVFSIVPERATTGLPTGKLLVGGAHWSGYSKLIRLNSDGTLDSTFNTAGAGFTSFYQLSIDQSTIGSGHRSNNGVRAILQERDNTGAYTGKIYVAGNFLSYNGVRGSRSFLRLNADGSIDNTYAANSAAGFAADVFILNDVLSGNLPTGRILIGGDFNGYGGTAVPMGIAKLTSTGALDASFSNAGFGFNGEISDVLEEKNTSGVVTGKYIITGGFSDFNGTSVGKIARLNSDGSLDGTFNFGTLGFGNGSPYVVKHEEDTSGAITGKLLIGHDATTYNSAAVPRGIFRINADGSHDNTFNNSGAGTNEVVLDLVQERSTITNLPTGNILIAGIFESYNGNAATPDKLMRIDSTGSYDASFNGGNAGFNFTRTKVILEYSNSTGMPTGLFIIAGETNGNYNGAAVNGGLARITATGALDGTFVNAGGGGFLLDGAATRVNDVVAERDLSGVPTGKFLVAGRFNQYEGGAVPSRLVRINSNGSWDNTFNSGGASWVGNVTSIVQELNSSTGLPTGNVLVGGWFNGYNTSNLRQGIGRITSQGVADDMFFGY